MRGLRHPDVLPGTDLIVVDFLTEFDRTVGDAAGWVPWRSYALHHLWTATARSTPLQLQLHDPARTTYD